jgi:hypothetical protein
LTFFAVFWVYLSIAGLSYFLGSYHSTYIYKWIDGNFVSTGLSGIFYAVTGYHPITKQLVISALNGVWRWDGRQWIATNITSGNSLFATSKAGEIFTLVNNGANGIYRWNGTELVKTHDWGDWGALNNDVSQISF